MMCKVLILSCLSAMIMIAAGRTEQPELEKTSLLKTLISDLNLLEEISNKIHLKLYTPNDRQECNWQVLQCYLNEMRVLRREIESEHTHHVINIKKNLQRLMHLTTPLGTGCKSCEAHDMKEFAAFHRELSNFLKSMLK